MKKCCLLNNIKPHLTLNYRSCPLNSNFDRFYSERVELLSPSPILGDLPEVRSMLIFFPKFEGLGGLKTKVLKMDEI
jgi:hypothetical protein